MMTQGLKLAFMHYSKTMKMSQSLGNPSRAAFRKYVFEVITSRIILKNIETM
jgi:hypothetical protein